MKYIKAYEVNNMSFLENYKTFILLIYPKHTIIVENLKNQLRKLFDDNGSGLIKHYETPFYFTLSINRFEEVFAYDSDNLNDILSNLDLYKQAKNYNL